MDKNRAVCSDHKDMTANVGYVGGRWCAGFSLVELIFILILLVIVAGLAIPLMGSSDGQRVGWAATQLESDIIYAQAQSLVHGADRRIVVLDADLNRYHLATASDPDQPLDHPVTQGPYLVAFGEGGHVHLRGVGIADYDLNGDNILGFGLYGQLDQATPATITLSAGQRRITLTIQPSTGQIDLGELQ